MLEKKVTNNEKFYLNVAKGLAIFLMLWGHCIQYCCNNSFDFFENYVFKFIYSFHMAFLMLISGYLFYYSCSKRKLSEIIDYKIKQLLYPILTCTILYCLFTYTLLGMLNGDIKSIIDINWLSHLDYYWFFWAVLICSIPVAISSKINNIIIRLVVYIGGGIFIAAISPCGGSSLWMYPYFIIGFIYAKYKNCKFTKVLCKFKHLMFVIFPIMLFCFKKEHYFYVSGFDGDVGVIAHMPINIFRWAIGLVGSIFIFSILEIIILKSKDNMIIRWLEKLGKNSLQIYALQCIFISYYLPRLFSVLVSFIGTNIFAGNIFIYNFLFTLPIALLFALFISSLISFIYKINIGKYIFGR